MSVLKVLQIDGMLFSLEGRCYWCFLQKYIVVVVSCASARNQSRMSKVKTTTYLSCSIWMWRTGWRACSSRPPGRPCSLPQPCSGRWSSATRRCLLLEAEALTCLAQPVYSYMRCIDWASYKMHRIIFLIIKIMMMIRQTSPTTVCTAWIWEKSAMCVGCKWEKYISSCFGNEWKYISCCALNETFWFGSNQHQMVVNITD